MTTPFFLVTRHPNTSLVQTWRVWGRLYDTKVKLINENTLGLFMYYYDPVGQRSRRKLDIALVDFPATSLFQITQVGTYPELTDFHTPDPLHRTQINDLEPTFLDLEEAGFEIA